MTTRENVRQRVRAWLKATCLPAAATLTDAQCVKAEAAAQGGMPRPAKPYLTVKVLADDNELGTDEGRVTDSAPTEFGWHAVGRRWGTVSIQGFGEDTADWLARAHLRLRDLEVLRTILADDGGAGGITLTRMSSGTRDLSLVLGDTFEPRYLVEYRFDYLASSEEDKQTGPAASTIEVDMDFESDSPPGDFSRTIIAP